MSIIVVMEAEVARYIRTSGVADHAASYRAERAGLPKALVASWIGPGSGFMGIIIAALGSALTLGGPVVGFSIGAAALKSGAGAPQVIADSAAWALYAIHRLVIWEVLMTPARLVWLRAAVSLPLSFIAPAMAMLLAKP